MLQCPHCQEEFELTMGRYFQGSTGKHVCPACSAHCKLQLPMWLRVMENSLLIPGIAVAVLVGVLVLHNVILGFVASFIWMGINIPLNVVLDGRFGWLALEQPGRPLPPDLPAGD